MFYVYLIKDNDSKIYIGYTSDLNRRINEHLDSKVYTTKRMKNPKLFYYEAYVDKESARERERKLKQYGSSYHGLLKRLKIK